MTKYQATVSAVANHDEVSKDGRKPRGALRAELREHKLVGRIYGLDDNGNLILQLTSRTYIGLYTYIMKEFDGLATITRVEARP